MEGDDRRGEGAVLGVNLGCLIVTNGNFATQLFPNYFGQQDLFSTKRKCCRRYRLCVSLSVCWAQRWALQKRLNWSRSRFR